MPVKVSRVNNGVQKVTVNAVTELASLGWVCHPDVDLGMLSKHISGSSNVRLVENPVV